jgi:hypothetical protein
MIVLKETHRKHHSPARKEKFFSSFYVAASKSIVVGFVLP